MPVLDFKGKSFVYAHHLSVPFRELVIDAKKSLPAKGQKPSFDDNLIIHGDNLHALKALLPRYAGKVDCIYIDPPYNTGNEGWCYNDNVRSPLMREWLKKSANPVEKEDLERHDKWLCMIWPRLKLLHELLSENGAIFISINDIELHRLCALMNEIFGEENFISCIANVNNPKGRSDDKYVATAHEYVLIFQKGHVEFHGWEPDDKVLRRYNKSDDSGKKYREIDLRKTGDNDRKEDRPNLFYYFLYHPKTGDLFPSHDKQIPKGYTQIVPLREDGSFGNWRWELDTAKNQIDRLIPKLMPVRKIWTVFEKDELLPDEQIKPTSAWTFKDVNSERGTEQFIDLGFNKEDFPRPKPIGLLTRLISLATSPDSIVLDSFAGSGTTAHAVLALNKKDNGNRKFILVECEEYADRITAERARRVIKGHKFEGIRREVLYRAPLSWTKLKNANELLEKVESIEQFEGSNFKNITKNIEDDALVVTGEKEVAIAVEGLGGSFTFADLGPEMTLEKLLADGLPTFDALAKYVFYTATGRTLSDSPKQKAAVGFIGETDLYCVHLHYQPDKGWLQSNDAALTEKLVDEMVAANKGKKKLLVFAAAKFMGQRELSKLGVDFCQLPYAIHRILGD